MVGDRAKSIAGFLAAVAVLGAVMWYIGAEDVVNALLRGDPRVAALTVPVAALWLSAWGMSMHTVLRALGARVAPHRAIFVFTAAVFANNVTPFGQAGGEPVSAMFISSVADSEYETGLAAIASVDTLHFVPSLTLAVVGLGSVALSAVEFTRNIVAAALAAAALVAVVPVAGYLLVRFSTGIKRVVVQRLTPVLQTVAGVVPVLTAPAKETVAARVDGFFASVGRVATDRRRVVLAMAFSAVGWLCLSASLWLSLLALGHSVPFVSILFVVPLGSIAGATPLPGGLGGLEVAFVALLVPLGVPASVGFSAVLIHRGATFWLPTLFGGGAATVLTWRARGSGE